MPQLLVQKKLNKRSEIPATLPQDKGIVDTVPQGHVFWGELVRDKNIHLPSPPLDKWYRDEKGFYYWGGALDVIENVLESNLSLSTQKPSWWIDTFGINNIWEDYHERGENALVAVIDSGYNINNPEVHDGVVGTYISKKIANRTTINDNHGHGTYCASIIGARNRTNIVGCAPACQLYISKMADGGSYGEENMIDAIEDAIKRGVDIISISNGGEKSFGIEASIKKAVANNVLVVAAIGNNENTGTVHSGGDYPALFDACIAVGATDKFNRLSPVTLINSKTEINAPGVDIVGYIKQLVPQKFEDSTSAATAVVAGICCLIISRLKKQKKPHTPSDIKRLILSFCNTVIDNQSQKLISPDKIFKAI